MEDDRRPSLPHISSTCVGTGRCLRLRFSLVDGGVAKLLGACFE